MRLICPTCGRDATRARPPITADRRYQHLDGSPLCDTPGQDQVGPPWPDDLDAWLPANPVAAACRAVALPRRHPCRTARTAVPTTAEHATVIDAVGGVDCPATITAGGCPWAASGLPVLDRAGISRGGGCWLASAPAQQIVTAMHQAGHPLPHRAPGLGLRRLDSVRSAALADWLTRHRSTYLRLTPTEHRSHTAAVVDYTTAWLARVATPNGGLRTVNRPVRDAPVLPPRRRRR